MKASDFLSLLGDSCKAVIKMACKSRRLHRPATTGTGEIIVLANGPSLRRTIDEYGSRLASHTTLCVNFMANTPEMKSIRPRYYVLADPHFFRGTDNANVRDLWQNLATVTWAMTLFVPAGNLTDARRLLGDSSGVEIATFNFVGIEGFPRLERLAYSRGWAMPRPRNVLVPAIMAAIAAGHDRIYIAGADHSWMETIRVDDENHVVSIQPHFYTDSKAETTRSINEYKGYRLHDILLSFYTAFSSYHRLQRFAASKGISIYNSTPGSFIDAFQRAHLPL